MKKISVIGAMCLLWSGTALAQANPNRGEEAAKHVAVVNADLESARAQAEMLHELSGSDAIFDKEHAKILSTNINRSLEEANAHIVHLGPLAVGGAEKKDFEQLEQTTGRVKTEAAKLENLDRKGVRSASQYIDKELDKAQDSLQGLSKVMKVPVDVD